MRLQCKRCKSDLDHRELCCNPSCFYHEHPQPRSDLRDKWQDNAIQFPRLIAELEAIGAFTESVIVGLANEMDLEAAHVVAIIGRAQREWDRIKAETLPTK